MMKSMLEKDNGDEEEEDEDKGDGKGISARKDQSKGSRIYNEAIILKKGDI